MISIAPRRRNSNSSLLNRENTELCSSGDAKPGCRVLNTAETFRGASSSSRTRVNPAAMPWTTSPHGVLTASLKWHPRKSNSEILAMCIDATASAPAPSGDTMQRVLGSPAESNGAYQSVLRTTRQSSSTRGALFLVTKRSPKQHQSMPVVHKHSKASRGVSTIGSPATLNDVFNRRGTPVIDFHLDNKACRAGKCDLLMVWTRPVPSTCTTAGTSRALSGLKRMTRNMKGLELSQFPTSNQSDKFSSRIIGAKGRKASRNLTFSFT